MHPTRAIVLFIFLIGVPFCKAADAGKKKPLINLPDVELFHSEKGIDTVLDCIAYPRLKAPCLSRNNISSFPGNLGSLFPVLVELYLDNNRMSTIPGKLPTLKILSLRNNNITTIVNDLNLPNLEHLDLTHNLIQTVEPQQLEQFPQLTFINLAKNGLNKKEFKKLLELRSIRPSLLIWLRGQKVLSNAKQPQKSH